MEQTRVFEKPLTAFIGAVMHALSLRPDCATNGAHVRSAIVSSLAEASSFTALENRRQALPILDAYLADALSRAHKHQGTAQLASSFQDLVEYLNWTRRAGILASDPFHDAHANALIIGPTGLVALPPVRVGVSLLAPGATYPKHHHPAEEIYIVLSPGEWFGEAAGWQSPGIGGLVHNCPDAIHAMRSGDVPLLAFWCVLDSTRR